MRVRHYPLGESLVRVFPINPSNASRLHPIGPAPIYRDTKNSLRSLQWNGVAPRLAPDESGASLHKVESVSDGRQLLWSKFLVPNARNNCESFSLVRCRVPNFHFSREPSLTSESSSVESAGGVQQNFYSIHLSCCFTTEHPMDVIAILTFF